MPMTLLTGIPGNGKTNWLVTRLRAEAERDGRPVFYVNIAECTIPGWVEVDAKTWMNCPPGSIVIVDECHKVFPVRQRGSVVPFHVEELAEHRGKYSVDLWLVTQHPTMIDTFVRKLCERHFHVVRAFGTLNIRVYEHPSGVQDYPEKAKKKDGVVLHQTRINKAAYGWYKSAEVHTVKRRIPMRFWVMIGAFLAVPLVFWLVYLRLWVHHNGAEAAKGAPGSAVVAASGRSVPAHLDDAKVAGAYLARFRPRIVGLQFTAPAYDELTKPVEAPYPSVCAFGPNFPCRCWSQRGFSLEVPKPLCEQLAREPMDPYWRRRGPQGFERPGDGGVLPREAGSSPAPASAPGALPELVAGQP